jgi:hypothetical protein
MAEHSGILQEVGDLSEAASGERRAESVQGSSDVMAVTSELMKLQVKDADIGAQPEVDVQSRDGRITGEISLPYLWLPRIYARGLCKHLLVLEILEESPDHQVLTVNACRWEDAPEGPVLRVRPAELRPDEADRYTVDWK